MKMVRAAGDWYDRWAAWIMAPNNHWLAWALKEEDWTALDLKVEKLAREAQPLTEFGKRVWSGDECRDRIATAIRAVHEELAREQIRRQLLLAIETTLWGECDEGSAEAYRICEKAVRYADEDLFKVLSFVALDGHYLHWTSVQLGFSGCEELEQLSSDWEDELAARPAPSGNMKLHGLRATIVSIIAHDHTDAARSAGERALIERVVARADGYVLKVLSALAVALYEWCDYCEVSGFSPLSGFENLDYEVTQWNIFAPLR